MEFFHGRTHMRLWSCEYGAYVRADEGGEDIIVHRDNETLDEARAAHCLVRDANDHYVLFCGASYDWHLVQIIDGESPGGLAVQCTYAAQEQDEAAFEAFGADRLRMGPATATTARTEIDAKPGARPCHCVGWSRPFSQDRSRLALNIRFWLSGRRMGPTTSSSATSQSANGANPTRSTRQCIGWSRPSPQDCSRLSVGSTRTDSGNLDEANNVLGITPCVQASSNGRLTPLVIDLPRNEKTMNIVILITGSPEKDVIFNTLLSGMALHGLPSRITEDQIGDMRVFLILVGDPHFFNVFNDCLETIVDQIEQQNSYREFLGNPMQQTVPSTCAIVSSVKCVEMQHRWEYETSHGIGTFPCQAASPRKLRNLCRREKTWTTKGAYVSDVMTMIKKMGGINTTNAPPPAPYQLPLHSWEQHGCDNGDGLTANRLMELLDLRGPFVGTLWVCPWYSLFDAKEDENLVYRSGCARNKHLQNWSKRCFGQYNVPLGLHSVLCFAYRLTTGGQLHILVLDNNSPTGPERWIDYFELQEIHTVSVKKLEPPVHLGGRAIVYPKSCYI